MGNNGALNFGVRQGSTNRVITSPGTYSNGVWHHVVGTVGDTGMNLYVDGVKVANRNDTSTGQSFNGYWRVGGDTLSGWTNRPTSDYFAGAIDEVAVYRQPLTANRIRNHYVASGRVVAGTPSRPTPTDRPSTTTVRTPSGASARPRAPRPQTRRRTARRPATSTAPSWAAPAPSAWPVTVRHLRRRQRLRGRQHAVQNPNVYSDEIWFKTSTTRGGKLMGFGSSRTGNSSSLTVTSS